LFFDASLPSSNIVKEALLEFENISGLKVIPSKSSFFWSGVSSRMKSLLLDKLHMQEGVLPVKYLGVLLISSRLSATDCRILLDWISSLIDSWTSRKLSFAGRLQLLNSVLYGLQVYWTGMFIFPRKAIKDLTSKFNRF
jgi:hypothetical protein